MINQNNFITIQGWMRTELDLKGNDLLVYAIIYGFSQTEDQKFTGGLQYLSDWCGATKQGILKNLKNLLDRGLIEKQDINKNGVKFVEYRVTQLNRVLNSVERGIKHSLTNNIENNQIDKIDKIVSKDTITDFQFGGKQKPKKESLYTKCTAMIYAKTDNPEIQKLLFSWLNMLLEKYKDRGKVLYANVFKGKLNMLDKYDMKDWKEIIEYNIQRGYEGFYPVSNSSYSADITKGKAWEENVSCRQATNEELAELERLDREREARGLRTKF